jgi:hypothetical protein
MKVEYNKNSSASKEQDVSSKNHLESSDWIKEWLRWWKAFTLKNGDIEP